MAVEKSHWKQTSGKSSQDAEEWFGQVWTREFDSTIFVALRPEALELREGGYLRIQKLKPKF